MTPEIFLKCLEDHNLLTSAWAGIPFEELPDDVKDDVKDCIHEILEHP